MSIRTWPLAPLLLLPCCTGELTGGPLWQAPPDGPTTESAPRTGPLPSSDIAWPDATATDLGADDLGGADLGPIAPGYLQAKGGAITDAAGKPVRLAGLSWFGLETSNFAPHGLWTRSMDGLLDQVVQLGFNVLRVPYCNQMLDPGSTPNGIDFNKNPDLQGLTPVEILDKLVAKAGQRKLRIFLDRHRPDAGSQSALWYTDAYSEQRWIDDWKLLAARYKGNPTVIGADLHNEPHDPATWGTGDPKTDWRLAAQKAGNAILGVNPSWLIIVEGVSSGGGKSTWWGGHLGAAGQQPVQLSIPGRLVYSPHDYPKTVYNQPWFGDPTYPQNLAPLWDSMWSYLAKQGIAPVLVGEFGTRYQDPSDKTWLKALVKQINDNDLSFTFWCLNPNSGDTGGILKDDWQTVEADKLAALKPVLAPLLP